MSILSPLDSAIAPPPDERRVAFLKAQPYAHRGLHGGAIVENSRAAFAAAIAAGHGIELDVQGSADGEVFVFHDATLDRLTGESGNVIELPGAALGSIGLRGTDETLPRLSEILALVADQAAILIEIKAPGALVGVLCLAVRRTLEGYRGPVAVMSFNPAVSRWFHDHAPRIVRGLVITEENDRGLTGRAKRHLSLWHARPDFLAYDIRDLPSGFAGQQRRRGLPVLTWTVRSGDQRESAAQHADQIIYENPA